MPPPRRSPRVAVSSSSSLGGGTSPDPTAGGAPGEQSQPLPLSPASDSTTLSSDDSGSNFEDTLPRRGKRGRRWPPSCSPVCPKVSKRPRRRQGTGRDWSNVATSSPEKTTLFEAIKLAQVAVETVVDEWLETYKRDHEQGFLELANLIIRSCGCKGEVTLEMIRNLQNSEIIQQLTEKFEEDAAEYPLSLSTQPWRRFRATFCELLTSLVERSQYSVIYDEFLMDVFIHFLISLSDSQVRAFRHTSTLAAMKLMTALVKVALGVKSHQENNQRQYEAERGKQPSRRSTSRLETLEERGRELREQQEEIENMMNSIFKGVFVHRYRDTVPDIRAICVEELGTWVRSYPGSFLTDGYLKYIGWTLHDKRWEVRLRCVKALQGLYSCRDMVAHMELFTSRFKTRMLCMVRDKETQVAVEVVKLLTLLLENMEEALTEEDCHNVYPLVYVANRPLATAAGLFLCRRLLEPKGEPSSQGDNRDNRTFFRLLLDFFIKSGLPEHATYLVDSLWDWAGPRLRDWETISALLLEESPAEGLTNQQEKALVDILLASVVQAAEGHPPQDRGPAKKLSIREQRAQVQEKTRLTHCLIPTLPQLLTKFSADAEKAAPLLEMLLSFNLNIYCTGRQKKHLDLVLGQLQEVVEKHVELEVLGAASRALYALCDPQLALHGPADLLRSRLADQLADRFHQEVAELVQASSLEEEELYSVAATLKRISVLFNAHDLTPWQLFEPCAELVQRILDMGTMPPRVLDPIISCLYFHILWELSHLPSTDVAKEQLQSLKNKVTSFCSLCHLCLSDPDAGVQEKAFTVLSDLLVIFGPQLPRDGRDALAPLVVQPEADLQSQLAAFLMDHVFYGDQEELSSTEDTERHVVELPQRRVFLAGFCKLIIYNVLELSAASDVFKHYAKFHSDYGDIIKEMLSLTRNMDLQEWGRTLLLSLKQLMTELLLQEGPDIKDTKGFQEIRDLARRFSPLFSFHQLQNRRVLVDLHKEGIEFAFQDGPKHRRGLPPLNLPFLEVLSEFSSRLLSPDKALLLLFLQRMGQGAASWPPLVTYRHSLQPQEEGASSSFHREAPHPQPPTKKTRMDGSSERQDPSPGPSSQLFSPALTSTTVRGGPPFAWQNPSSNPSLLQSISGSFSHQGSRMSQLSLMVEEDQEEEEEAAIEEQSSEDRLEQSRDHLQDLFDSALDIKD